MYGIYHYVDCINVLIHTCLITLQDLYVSCLFRDDYSLIDNNDITKEDYHI